MNGRGAQRTCSVWALKEEKNWKSSQHWKCCDRNHLITPPPSITVALLSLHLIDIAPTNESCAAFHNDFLWTPHLSALCVNSRERLKWEVLTRPRKMEIYSAIKIEHECGGDWWNLNFSKRENERESVTILSPTEDHDTFSIQNAQFGPRNTIFTAYEQRDREIRK